MSRDRSQAQGDNFNGIIRVHKSRDFSVINNTGLRDTRMSFGARGILGYLLTKPDNWQLRVEDLIHQSPAGEYAVRQMLRELKRYGYLKRERKAGRRGRFEWHTAIYEVPQEEEEETVTPVPTPDPQPTPEAPSPDDETPDESPSGDFPQMDKPHVEGPQMENPDVEKPRVENRPIYEVLREESLSDEILREGGSEGESSREDAPTRASPHFESPSILDPNPREALDLMALVEACNVSLVYASAKDLKFWALAVQTVRDAMPDSTPLERAQAVREFKARWQDGGRRGNVYLSQVVTHWHRVMKDALRGVEPQQPTPQGQSNGRSRQNSANRYESAAERRGRKWEQWGQELGVE